MAMDGRNFRSSYYEKVGCYSVEETKSLNKLLQDNVRNYAKLKQFCLSYTVPHQQRLLLWSIILGIMPLHKDSSEFIVEQRKAVYNDLFNAISIMQYVDQMKPKSYTLYNMWLLENNQLFPSGVKNSNITNFIDIVNVMLQLFDSDIDSYWIAKEFLKSICDIQNKMFVLKEITQTLLKQDDLALYKKLHKMGIFVSNGTLERWYKVCFAGIINESGLVRVWDKICGGSRKIIIFIFLEIVKVNRDNIMKTKNIDELIELIEKVKHQESFFVNKAIKAWQSDKLHSEVKVHTVNL